MLNIIFFYAVCCVSGKLWKHGWLVNILLKFYKWDFLGGPVIKSQPCMQGMIWSLVRELHPTCHRESKPTHCILSPGHHTWESMCHQERFCMTLPRSCMLQDSTQPNKYMLKDIFKVSSRILSVYFRQSLHSEFIMDRLGIEYLNICCIIIDFFYQY